MDISDSKCCNYDAREGRIHCRADLRDTVLRLPDKPASVCVSWWRGGHPSLSLSSPPLSVSVLPRHCPARVSLPRLAPIKHPLQGARGCPAHFKVIKRRNQQTCTRGHPLKKKTLQVLILETILVALWRIQMETKWCLTQLREERRKLPGILFCVSETSECLEERGRQRLVGGWGGSLASGRGWSNLCCGGSLNNLAWMVLAAAAAAGD